MRTFTLSPLPSRYAGRVFYQIAQSGFPKLEILYRLTAVTDEYSLTFLGTGTSVGVPVIGCSCKVCVSQDPRNQRLRSSVVLRAGGVALLVDSGPDLRQQALRTGLRELDGVLYTHAHLDHVAGFDELRAFCWHRRDPLPLHGTEACLATLKAMFGWAFAADNIHHGYVKPDPRVVCGTFRYGNLQITPLPVEHGGVETIGYRFDYLGGRSLAYLPDVKRIPQATMRLLHQVDVLVLDALRPAPHPTHLCLSDAIAVASDIKAGETWLTHLGHENDHLQLAESLPLGVAVAWDGLTLFLGNAR
jgi:phosphoribosyl 1,2-cyclic phosphate phosphodiesterase